MNREGHSWHKSLGRKWAIKEGMTDRRLDASDELVAFVMSHDQSSCLERQEEQAIGEYELDVTSDTLMALFLSDHPEAKAVCFALERLLAQ